MGALGFHEILIRREKIQIILTLKNSFNYVIAYSKPRPYFLDAGSIFAGSVHPREICMEAYPERPERP
ncbi:hypothetical protein GCM10010967_10450 [Dyadobacter beijingensis]|uniref:Uncharacterized protein n=1 Tax=Dyadobacter beijingensis TaxID=365489 RepID=A0ABQ2HJU8_9BACT|nr:hypothetical protein GCM10010967_10450 [Dyadobacter beijingensis]